MFLKEDGELHSIFSKITCYLNNNKKKCTQNIYSPLQTFVTTHTLSLLSPERPPQLQSDRLHSSLLNRVIMALCHVCPSPHHSFIIPLLDASFLSPTSHQTPLPLLRHLVVPSSILLRAIDCPFLG